MRAIDYLLENHSSVLNWGHLSLNPALTPDFIEKYKDKWHWPTLARNPAFTPALIDKYSSLLIEQAKSENIWCSVAQNPSSVDMDLLNELKDNGYIKCLSQNPNLPTNFILQNWDLLNWSELNLFVSLSQPLIDDIIYKGKGFGKRLVEQYTEADYLYLLSGNPSLSKATIDKYIGSWDWSQMCKNPAFLRDRSWQDIENIHTVDVEWQAIEWNVKSFSSNPALTPELIEECLNHTHFYYWGQLDMNTLSKNPALTPAFIEKNIDKLSLYYLSQNPSFDLKLIYQYLNNSEISWEGLAINPNINTKIIDIGINAGLNISTNMLSANPALFAEELGIVNHMGVF